MAVRYVTTELRQGLRRNFSMHLAVVITLLVSLTLAGVGGLLWKEAKLTTQRLGGELQITVFLCSGVQAASGPHCTGRTTDTQKQLIQSTLRSDAGVGKVHLRSSQDLYNDMKKQAPPASFQGPNPAITLAMVPESFEVTMTDAHNVDLIKESVRTLPGVDNIKDQHELVHKILSIVDAFRNVALTFAIALLAGALLLVSNTVRLAAFARRREISIMRLVGASSLYIMLPFLLEVLVTAIVGAGLAIGALFAFEKFVVNKVLAPNLQFTNWVTWSDVTFMSVAVLILSAVLTLVPALLMTRRYVKI